MGSALISVLFSLALPVLFGWTAGYAVVQLRGGRLRSTWSASLLFLARLVLPFLTPHDGLTVGFWDQFVLAGLFGAGLFAGGHALARRVEWKSLALLAVVVVVASLTTELVCRFLPAPQMYCPPAADVRFFLRKSGQDASDARLQEPLAYPALNPDAAGERLLGVKGSRRVLHVGDSMVHGTTVAGPNTFVGILDSAHQDLAHINAGVPGTGPDYYLLLALNWLDYVEVEHLVVYLFAANDLSEIDRDYLFCAGGPLLHYPDDHARLRCPEPDWRVHRFARLWHSPSPYFLRVLSSVSAA